MESYQIKFYKKYIRKSNIDAEQVITRFEELIEDFQWVFIEKKKVMHIKYNRHKNVVGLWRFVNVLVQENNHLTLFWPTYSKSTIDAVSNCSASPTLCLQRVGNWTMVVTFRETRNVADPPKTKYTITLSLVLFSDPWDCTVRQKMTHPLL